MTVEEKPSRLFSMTSISSDPSGGRVFGGFLRGTTGILTATDLEESSQQQIFKMLLQISTKLTSLVAIRKSYELALDSAKEEARSSVAGRGVEKFSVQSTELMGWADVYLVQVKSTLDHLVKVPSPVVGYKYWNLRSFGNKGRERKECVRKSTERI